MMMKGLKQLSLIAILAGILPVSGMTVVAMENVEPGTAVSETTTAETTVSDSAASEESESEISESRVVRVACGMNDALYLDDAGDPAGSCLSYIRQLAWNKNWILEYVEGSYNESLQNLIDGKVDLMFPVSKEDDTDGRLAYSDFIGGYQQIGLFAKADADIYYDDYEGFDGKKVGISIGSNSHILDDVAKANDFTYLAIPLNTVQDKIDALDSGEVDMVAFSTLNDVPGGKLVAILDQVPIYFCTSADNQALVQEVNESMSQSMVNTPDIVAEMYQNILKGNNITSYTKEENDKIESADTITFGVYSDCLPLAGINSSGECVGIYVDTLKEIAELSGLNIEIKPIEDSNRLYSYMDDGTVDFVIGIQELRFSSENAENYLASNGIADFTTVAVSMPDYQFEESVAPVIALTKSRNYLESYIYSNFPDAVIQYFDTRKECLNAVRNGKADATFINTWEYNYETKNPRFRDLMEWESMRITSVYGLGGTKQSDLELLSILEKTISQIPKNKISDIIAANLNMAYDAYDFEDRFYEVKDELLVITIILAVIAICLGSYMRTKRGYIRDLEQANKAKTDFLSRMSHELRTPLNAINGYAELTTEHAAEGTLVDEELQENMLAVRKASGYLLGIIKDILDVQRMETGKIAIEKTEINPNDYMHTVVQLIQPLADEKQIQFTYTMINGEKENYLMDGLRVQQVLFNILYNAVKFTPDGGRVTMTSEVTDCETADEHPESAAGEQFEVEQSEGKSGSSSGKTHMVEIQFVISDTGIGMSKDFMQTKLFQKFAQENQDLTSPYAGCGNGLAICKELVTLMGGEILCESEQGKGTTFVIKLREEAKKRPRKRRERKPRAEYNLSGIHILMCEDNLMNQDIEKSILEHMHCTVEIAEDGKVGLKKFAESEAGTYSVILMDIRMPNMDGLEATQAIRALDHPDAKTIPILAVSANAFEEDVQKSLAAGMNEHLSKPVDAQVLYEKIKAYCCQNKE